MKPTPSTARILVATDSVNDADQILRLLANDFDHVHASTNSDRTVEEFEEYKPDVLVLAFDTLDKAQRYYLGLYRLGQSLHQHVHRTVILCSKDEVRAVFELCKKQYFDDYVLYWPYTYDGPRLAMSIWIACREMMSASHTEIPQAAELRVHAKHVGELEKSLDRQIADGERQIAIVRSSIQQAEKKIAGAIDDFSHRLVSGEAETGVEVKDTGAFALEINKLKTEQLSQTHWVGEVGVEPISNWALTFKEKIEPSLSGARVLTEKVSKIRPIVMVVDDDELAQHLVSRTLGSEAYEIIFVGDAPSALGKLRHIRPDVILMDFKLPGMDGVELTQHLKASADFAQIPIILMTGDSRRETLKHSIEVGVAAFVVKPFTRESLTSKLKQVLHQ